MPFPWIYPYVEDLTAQRYPLASGRTAYRPLVPIGLRGPRDLSDRPWALVDSGSEHTLIAGWIARAMGLERQDPLWRLPLRLGGDTHDVAFHRVSIRLFDPGGVDEAIEWESEVGVLSSHRITAWSAVLGQVGFFDRFTVTMQRAALATVVEDYDAFDARFGMRIRVPSNPSTKA